MYVLYTDSTRALDERSQLFAQHMEPLLQRCDAAMRAGMIPADIAEIPQYLKVCRWPFRRLEYSFALDALTAHLRPGQRFLDAGSGATPFAHALAELGVEAEACDGDSRLISQLQRLQPETIYGSKVRYSAQDLTAMSFSDDSFDAIACISVLEHIPAPHDKRAVGELMRILKPGGLLVFTVDFQPQAPGGGNGHATHLVRRSVELVRKGDLGGLIQGVQRKLEARRAVSGGAAQLPRSANQCFELAHLEQDLGADLRAHELPSRLGFTSDLQSLTTSDARSFWELQPGLFDDQGRRFVLPAASIVQKPAVS